MRRLIIPAALLLVGCGSGSPKDPSDFTYNPPDGFTQQDTKYKQGTVFMGPTDSGFKSNLLVVSNNTDKSAKDIGDEKLGKLKGDPTVTIKEQEPYQIPDSDAYTWRTGKTLKNGTMAGQRQFVVVKNRVEVEFTMTASDKLMDQCDQALSDSLKSFKWGR